MRNLSGAFLLSALVVSTSAWAGALPLLDKYVGEQFGMHSLETQDWVHVYYFDEEEQQTHEARKNPKGKLFNTCEGLLEGRVLYVILEDGRMIVSRTFIPGKFHHSTLAAGRPVLAAGTLLVRNGKVLMVDGLSGHYMPRKEHTVFAETWLKKRGMMK